MSIYSAIILFILGLVLVIYFAEIMVKGTVGTSKGFGISTFLISVIFIGFDPENLAVGAVGAYENLAGIALGSIIGAAMVAIALAFGITALITPLKFKTVPASIVAISVSAVLLLFILSIDGQISRIDGVLLLTGYLLSLVLLIWLGKRDIDIQPGGEIEEAISKASENSNKWKSFGLLLLSIIGIIAGSEMLVSGSETVIEKIGLSDTVFGMTILSLLVSIEELARELPAALKGRPEISYGNVVGSILAFFLFNAGIIALVNPVPVNKQILLFHIPAILLTTIVISFFLMRKKVTRLAGAILVTLYAIFFAGSFIL